MCVCVCPPVCDVVVCPLVSQRVDGVAFVSRTCERLRLSAAAKRLRTHKRQRRQPISSERAVTSSCVSWTMQGGVMLPVWLSCSTPGASAHRASTHGGNGRRGRKLIGCRCETLCPPPPSSSLSSSRPPSRPPPGLRYLRLLRCSTSVL